MRERVDVLGVGVDVTTMPRTLEGIEALIRRREHGYVCVTGVHGVMESRRDPELRRIHRDSRITVPDGRPMVWCGWAAGARSIRQVRGVDLLACGCELAERRGWSVYFYGGAPGTPELLADRLLARFPGLVVAGTQSPPFRPLTRAEDEEVVARINASGADVVWVGISTPKQERWMAAHLGRISPAVMIGVGAAFDVHAGLKAPGPRWAQLTGLEWLFRLSREPRRLWRRYLRNNPAFLAAVLLHPPRLYRQAPRGWSSR
ncbi:MAG: WecB/TagA/CpsF family glycosyltransferase [Solirubrobacterales bacterium]